MPWTFYTSAGVAKTGEYLGSEFPVGTITQTAATAAGTGWLFCDGSSLVRATYPELFTAIGVTYGSASGSTFTLPDLRGRVPVGAGTGTGLTARALAATGGTETHTLTSAQLPSHTHTGSGVSTGQSQNHEHSGTTNGASVNHSHSFTAGAAGAPYVVAPTLGGTTGANQVGTGGHSADHSHTFGTSSQNRDHTHTTTITTSTDSTGGGSHPIVQPFVAINFMIYAVTYARRAG